MLNNYLYVSSGVVVEGLFDRIPITDNGPVGHRVLVPARRRILLDSGKHTRIPMKYDSLTFFTVRQDPQLNRYARIHVLYALYAHTIVVNFIRGVPTCAEQ